MFDEDDTKNVIKTLADFVQTKGGKPTSADFFEELRMQQLAKVFDNKVRLFITFEALCGSSMDAKALSQHTKVVDHVISNAKMSTSEVAWALNAYLKANPGVAKSLPMTMKAAFDEDWLVEKDLLAYYNDDEGEGEPGFEEAKKAIAQFLKWLETADSDSDDDNSDSD